MTASEVLAELDVRGVELAAHGDRLVYDAPAGVMTAELRDRVKACKPELLEMLVDEPEPVAPAQLETRECRRFLAVCRPWLDGRGWYDPAQRSAAKALARADDAPTAQRTPERQPDRDKYGMTAVERAERWRAEWKVSGYPPGVKPKADKKRG